MIWNVCSEKFEGLDGYNLFPNAQNTKNEAKDDDDEEETAAAQQH